MILSKYFARPPVFLLIAISLSFKSTMKFFIECPALLNPQKSVHLSTIHHQSQRLYRLIFLPFFLLLQTLEQQRSLCHCVQQQSSHAHFLLVVQAPKCRFICVTCESCPLCRSAACVHMFDAQHPKLFYRRENQKHSTKQSSATQCQDSKSNAHHFSKQFQ